MRYTKEQIENTAKLIVEALYGQKNIDEAMEEVFSKDVAVYRNFKQNVKYLEMQMNGKTPHLATPHNWAKAIYKFLRDSDKLKFLDAMDRQVIYDAKYGTPSHTLKKWIKNQRQQHQIIIYPDEIDTQHNATLIEGAKKQVTVNIYERDPKARAQCIEHYGYDCSVCGFNFEKVYGQVGKDFIHVHHIKPLSEIKEAYSVDPVKDLRPVCPNCHAMLHKKIPAYSIEELKSLLEDNK